ncbi:hypothetical protein [Aneurinibacillus sp. REN35]|uniref:hypothetical protein n=1 Tax=Aneurinibacillus sp. REN35 TaxID=3237286 RepID=UPI0035271D3A
MNKRYLPIILFALLGSSVVSSFAFYDLWTQEKGKVIELKKELKKANKQIEALNSNHEQEINKVASDFVERLFTYDPHVYENGKEAAIEMTSGEASEKLTSQQVENQYGEFGVHDKSVTSFVSITDSVYNKTGDDTAEVIVQFEQELVVNRIRSESLSKIKLYLIYVGDEWKVANYKTMQVI